MTETEAIELRLTPEQLEHLEAIARWSGVGVDGVVSVIVATEMLRFRASTITDKTPQE